jgi:glycosyltransferase involved in cell wall biosynthesis
MTRTISVAMATYNGARYLPEQLDSLAAQTCRPLELVVSDDGSTDATMEIVEAFAERAPFPVQLERNRRRLGFADNFLCAAQRCRGEWIAFCDQDDVWLPHRLADATQAIGTGDEDLMMVVQAAELADRALEPLGRRLPDIPRRRIRARNSHYGFWVRPGFSLTVRARMLHELSWSAQPPNYFPGHVRQSHDKWCCMLANALGNVVYLPETAAVFRRHEAAATGLYGRRGVRGSVDCALKTGQAHYAFLSTVASESAACLRRLSEESPDPVWSARLKEGAALFDRLSDVQTERAALYSSQSTAARLRHLSRLLRRGGYFGHPFVCMPLRALAKDLVICFIRPWIQASAPGSLEPR